MAWFWFGLAVALVAVEALTTQLVSIWLAAAGVIMAILVAIFPDLGIGWQVLIFVVLSAAAVAATRPLAKKFLNRSDKQSTNLELVVGHNAIVTEKIDNLQGKGAVKINGLEWSARTTGGESIECGAVVKILEIQGNKVFVKKEGEK